MRRTRDCGLAEMVRGVVVVNFVVRVERKAIVRWNWKKARINRKGDKRVGRGGQDEGSR